MLERLLSELRSGVPTTPAILAGRLNTSVEMVQVMLEKLAALGYLQESTPAGCNTLAGCSTLPGMDPARINPPSGAACQACSVGGLCGGSTPARSRLWVYVPRP